jgi:hypothetical protein
MQGGDALFVSGTLSQLRGRMALHSGHPDVALRHFTLAAEALSQVVGDDEQTLAEARAQIKQLSVNSPTSIQGISTDPPPRKN